MGLFTALFMTNFVKVKFYPDSRAQYVTIMNALAQRGAEGIILGCTEIMLLVSQQDSPVPVFDTTTLHAVAAVEFALEGALEFNPH